MKRLFILPVFFLLFLMRTGTTQAASFTVLNDTVYVVATTGSEVIWDSVLINTGGTKLDWKVISSNFPSDWLSGGTGLCDNKLCYNLNTLWPSMVQKTSLAYTANDTGTIDMILALTSTFTPGCYYVTARVANSPSGTDVATITWFVCWHVSAGVQNVNAPAEVKVYPNPATTELTINCGQDMTHADVVDIFGAVVKSVNIQGGNATVQLSDMAAGMYFVRVQDANGATAVTRKFIKQ